MSNHIRCRGYIASVADLEILFVLSAKASKRVAKSPRTVFPLAIKEPQS
jgi:hypothetical protein